MSKVMLNIGNATVREQIGAVAEAINLIFESANKNRIDQATVVNALNTLTQITEVKHVTVTGSTFVDKSDVHYDKEDR